MLSGKKIFLTAVEKEDLKQLMDWRNMPELRKHFREYREINSDMQESWYKAKVLNDPCTLMFAVRKAETGELLGCCGLCYINWVHRNADLSLYIGSENAYIDEKGYAEESCRLLFKYGFHELGLNKIWTEIYEFDNKKFELYERLGMKRDGILREQYFYDGKWWNSYIMSITLNDYIPKGGR